eukprot:157492_1
MSIILNQCVNCGILKWREKILAPSTNNLCGVRHNMRRVKIPRNACASACDSITNFCRDWNCTSYPTHRYFWWYLCIILLMIIQIVALVSGWFWVQLFVPLIGALHASCEPHYIARDIESKMQSIDTRLEIIQKLKSKRQKRIRVMEDKNGQNSCSIGRLFFKLGYRICNEEGKSLFHMHSTTEDVAWDLYENSFQKMDYPLKHEQMPKEYKESIHYINKIKQEGGIIDRFKERIPEIFQMEEIRNSEKSETQVR